MPIQQGQFLTFPIMPDILCGQIQNCHQILEMWQMKMKELSVSGFQFKDAMHYDQFVKQMVAEFTVVESMLSTLISVMEEGGL